MGVLCDYFVVAEGVDPAVVLDEPGGPISMNSGQLRGLVETKGVDPAVEASCLQSALTGEELSALLVDPAAGSLVAMVDDGERMVLGVHPGLVSALAGLDLAQAGEVATTWAEVSRQDLGLQLADRVRLVEGLAGLARAAHDVDERVYCWVCV